VRLEGEGIALRRLVADDAAALLELRLRNREFFAPFEPVRDPSFFTLPGQALALADEAGRWERGDAYGFGITERDDDAVLLGWVILSNVVRGAWQNATIGYAVDEAANGRGVATEAVGLAVGFAFEYADLHRVQAAVLPRNVRSTRVLAKNGFRREGRSRYYLQIAGVWADHDIYAITREDVGPA
jgi:ribosomal-protein-alanine N-acetyltransferase